MDRLSLAELSERTDIAPRTIRFYIAQGLLPGPLRSGRSAEYGEDHIRVLKLIKNLQSEGLTLSEVAFALDANSRHLELSTPVMWSDYHLAEDVVVRVREDINPWRHKAIRRVLSEMAVRLRNEKEEKEQ